MTRDISDSLRWYGLAAAAILAVGLMVGGYLLGNGLVRARHADRSVTVRGLAERDVTADLATWTLTYSEQGTNLQQVQASIDRDTATIRKFFSDLGIPDEALQPAGAGVNQSLRNGVQTVTINQRLQLRTTDIAKARKAVASQFDLVRQGVVLQEGSGMEYSFTRLNEIKPEMVAEATRDARAAAEQFAKDSDTQVGGIKNATQGYFSVQPRDGDGGGYGVADTPYKKVRVVTTVNFYLD
ncbi:SIMPL domain-containing protein [Altericroceibacterium spongiae]|uniref:SIMPL domain-containing protein n=1 Tax=Altericroceibacterium spongiae TaxID=2320269 RepID=A0A420EE53_9SPHN|nr:SIMPL domain-containing protein [Altericroceibacterium spongiae]RKF18961.1 SIMPL domain-containing protein [Altericroceibacterium spongiae]